MWTRPHTGTTSVGAPGGRSVGDRRCKVLMAQKNESSPLTPPPLSWNQTRRLPISPSRRPLLRRRSGTDPPSLPPRLSSSGGDQPHQLSHLASLPPGGTNRSNCLTLPLVAVPYPPASRRSSRPRPRPREMRVQRCRGRRLRRGSHAPPRGCPGRRPTPPARCKGRLSGSPAQSTLMRLPGSPSHNTCRRNRQVSASLLHMALWHAACGME